MSNISLQAGDSVDLTFCLTLNAEKDADVPIDPYKLERELTEIFAEKVAKHIKVNRKHLVERTRPFWRFR